jgi:hypothetical protein
MTAILPDEIKMINPQTRRVFAAHPCVTANGNYIYDPMKDAYRYRIEIPGVESSMVVVDVRDSQIRNFLQTKKPIPVPHA